MTRLIVTIFALSITLGLSGCGSIIAKPVTDADRDTTGNFDGRWTMQLKSTRGRQQVGGAYFNCEFKTRTVQFSVKNSVASMYYGSKKVNANVGSDGRFRFEILTDRHYSGSRTGEKSHGSRITDIYQGNLSEKSLKGQFIIGKKSENNHGCATRLSLKKS